MGTRVTEALLSLWMLLSSTFPSVPAKPLQVPTLQVCNQMTQVRGKAIVKIASRSNGTHAGIFEMSIQLRCRPRGYPEGKLQIDIDMSDSAISGILVGTTFEQLTSTGKRTPTAYLNGRCKAGKAPGCRFWLMVVDNSEGDKGTPDVIGFLVLNEAGNRVAYGTGPVAQGDITVRAE
ncbi:MAG: hypothetical protein V3R47_03295 [candidate division NC10 bacterium]